MFTKSVHFSSSERPSQAFSRIMKNSWQERERDRANQPADVAVAVAVAVFRFEAVTLTRATPTKGKHENGGH